MKVIYKKAYPDFEFETFCNDYYKIGELYQALSKEIEEQITIKETIEDDLNIMEHQEEKISSSNSSDKKKFQKVRKNVFFNRKK